MGKVFKLTEKQLAICIGEAYDKGKFRATVEQLGIEGAYKFVMSKEETKAHVLEAVKILGEQ